MTDFNYVVALLDGADFKDITPFTSIKKELSCVFRDCVFKEILDSFEEKPVKVFQVGAIESLQNQFRLGSGWSDIFWGDYIKKNGGRLIIADIDLDHIANSSFMAQKLKYNADFYICDAIYVIGEGFDIYYLDGADINQTNDAHNQTLEQFKAIENTNSIVLVDDVPTKAKELKQYVLNKAEEMGWILKEYSQGNGMMTIDMRK
jgi:hypothetical protein